MMNSPTGLEPGAWTTLLRVVSWMRRQLRISIGVLAPRPVPSTVELLARPTREHLK